MDEQFNYQGSDFTCQLLSNVIENVVEFVTNTGNNANIDIRGKTEKKLGTKFYPPRPLIPSLTPSFMS